MGKPLQMAVAWGDSVTAPAVTEPWITSDQLAYCNASDSVDMDSVCRVASEILFLLSGRKYGVRTETVRPYAGQRACGWGALTGYGASLGQVYAYYDGTGKNDRGVDWLKLKSPTRRVVGVMLDGVLMDPSGYQLFDNSKLVRLPNAAGASMLWPLYQAIDRSVTEQGTFSVTYQWGQDIPEGGQLAATTFACQLAKYLNNDSDCALPDRVISVTRQGVSQTMLDPGAFIKEARTGLYLVDTWLGAVNPNGNRSRPSIMGPDSMQQLRST